MKSEKSQSSVEFLVLASFMLLVILGFFAITGSKALKTKETLNKGIAQDLADYVYQEVEIAKAVNDGYVRNFNLPQTVNGINYNISIIGNREIIVNYLGFEHVKFLPSNVTGNVDKGVVQIRKIGGIIYLNSVTECNDTIDNDNDALKDLLDAGCFNSLDTDESNCGDSACEGIETCLTCVADCGTCFNAAYLLFKDGVNTASFRANGDLILKGVLTPNNPQNPTGHEELVIKNLAGNAVAIIDIEEGDISLDGQLFERQSTLNPTADSFIIKDTNGNVLSFFDQSGNLYLKGSLTQNGNP